MPVERPTFSESWYRVADLRPRLRATVQVHRQHYRGRLWHVLQDAAANQFLRLNEPAYHFVALLDGRRTVAEAWRLCSEQLGDSSPTQNEAIQFLAQLHLYNLLYAELPPDAEGLFRRYRKRRVREVQGFLTNLLFVRIPLLDPERFLQRWVGVFGRVFSPAGLVLWLALLAAGLYVAFSRFDELIADGGDLLARQQLLGNLPLLYAAMAITKVFHEFGHAFACKRFGRWAGGGEVHVMGVMFLVFLPLPYVDASSAWAFRSKWRRVVVGASGMMVELAVAAVAAIVWAGVDPGRVRALCYNMMFIASVSSLLFNGNPLLRYDAYYILSDLLEIPNLAPRSREYIYYLVKRYVWGVRHPRDPAHSAGERAWFLIYGPASTAYRIFIFSVILLYLTDRLPEALAIVAVAFGAVAAFTWLCVPAGKLIRYLATSGELARVRGRAVLTTALAGAAVVAPLLAVPLPDRVRADGIVEPASMAVIYAEADGFVADVLPSGSPARPEGPPLLRCVSAELDARLAALRAERRRLQAGRRLARTEGPAAVAVIDEKIAWTDARIAHVASRIEALTVRAPLAGTWVAPDADRLPGTFVEAGARLGLVADLDALMVRAVVGQDDADRIDRSARAVDIRVKGRPGMRLPGVRRRGYPAGQEKLPSAALGYAVGGAIPTAPDDPEGLRPVEPVFPVLIAPDPAAGRRLRSGQRVVVRFDLPDKPLALQWWRSLRQLFQRRFHV